MKFLKKADFYRKYTNEDKVPSLLGACMSVLTIACMLLLITFELSFYMYPHLNREVVTNQKPISSPNDTIPLNINVYFPKMPCKCM